MTMTFIAPMPLAEDYVLSTTLFYKGDELHTDTTRMREALANIVRRYYCHSNAHTVREITIERLPLDAQGYSSVGTYYGTGAPVFMLTVTDTYGDWNVFTLRAPSRKALRADLRTLFGKVIKIGR